jgi:hypothetical protein
MYLVSSSSADVTNFRYVFDVYETDGTTLISRVKLPARPVDGRGLFDAKRIIENYVTYDLPTLGENAGFYRNDNSFYKYSVKIGEEYGTTPVVVANQQTVSGKYIFNGVFDWRDFIDYLYTDYILTKGLTGKPFLSNAPTTQNIELNQNAWLGVMTYSSGSIQTAEFKKYDSNNVLLGAKYINNIYTDLTGSEAHRFLRFAVGTANIESHSPGWITGADHYTVQILDSSSGTTSILRQYNLTNNCRYETVRLHFLNKYGGWDSFNFNLVSSERNNVERSKYKKRYGSTTGTSWSYTTSERGNTTFNVLSSQSIFCNSDWLSESERFWLKELISSPEAYQEIDGKLYAIDILTSVWEPKTQRVKSLQNLLLEFSYSNDNSRQRG